MNVKRIRSGIGASLMIAGLAAGMLAHPAAAAGPPVAADDSYAVQADALSWGGSVLDNDVGSGNGSLTPAIVQNAAHGLVTLQGNGNFSYSASPGYSGLDMFTYQVSDNGGTSNVASVYLNVKFAPVGNPDFYSTPQNTPLTVFTNNGVLVNDSDAENDPMLASNPTTTSHGQLSFAPNGSFTYSPDPGFVGVDTFLYHPYDGAFVGADTQVSITVTSVVQINKPPVGIVDSYTVKAGEVLQIPAPGVLGNDVDPENDKLTAEFVVQNGWGTWTLDPDGSFSYEPGPNGQGLVSLEYMPYDGTNYGNNTLVTVKVSPPDPPAPTPTSTPSPNMKPVAVDDHYYMTAGTKLTIPAPGVLSNDTDPENDPLNAEFWQPNDGKVTGQIDGSFEYDPEGFVGDAYIPYQPVDVNANWGNQAWVTITILPAETPTPTPTDIPGGGTPPPSETPVAGTPTLTPTEDGPGGETPPPPPPDNTGDETPTPPSGPSGGDSTTPVPTEVPGDPTSTTPDGSKTPDTQVGGVTELPNTGTGSLNQSSDSMPMMILKFLVLAGLSLVTREVRRRFIR